MARPKKTGFDYFPFDVDFFRNIKIRATIGRFGIKGIVLYIYLLTLIYSEKGYYLEYNEDVLDIASADLNMTSNEIGQIINFFCKRSLFDYTLFTTDKVLTSAGIQSRYQEMAKKRAKNNTITVNSRFWVLNEEETQGFIKVHPNDDYSEKNYSYSEKNPSYSKKNYTKERKVKKSKVNESKVNESSAISITLSDNSSYDIDQTLLNYYKATYTNIDVLLSLRKLANYMDSHEDKRKNIHSIESYIRLWLEQDSSKAKAKEVKPIEQKQYIKGVDYF